ncbi:SMI1/KNR4 family protein [Actinocorallia lasiicapitis]
MLVGSMLLPEALVAAITDGTWLAPADRQLLSDVFASEVVDPRFYSLEGIVSETTRWHGEHDLEVLAEYLGEPDPAEPPGDIVQDRSVFIGDLGPDMPFALDYRDGQSPAVIFLTISGGWRQIAPDFETFLRAVGIGGSDQ